MKSFTLAAIIAMILLITTMALAQVSFYNHKFTAHIGPKNGDVVDGGFFTPVWGFPPLAEAYPIDGSAGIGTNPWQWWNFIPVESYLNYYNSDFTICDGHENSITAGIVNGACLNDSGQGYVGIGFTNHPDTWRLSVEDNEYVLRNNRTGFYMGAIPQGRVGFTCPNHSCNIPMSSTPVSIELFLVQ